MTKDEANNAAEDAYTRQFDGEPPLTMKEQAEMQAKRDARGGVR